MKNKRKKPQPTNNMQKKTVKTTLTFLFLKNIQLGRGGHEFHIRFIRLIWHFSFFFLLVKFKFVIKFFDQNLCLADSAMITSNFFLKIEINKYQIILKKYLPF